MDLKELATSLASEAKILADDVKSIATGQTATEVAAYIPSLAPFLKAVATYAGDASGLLALVPLAETLITVAENFGVRAATGDELAELDKAHEGYSAD